MANAFLQAEWSTGNVFEYSKEPKEGFQEFTSSKGNVSYRRYLDAGLIGIYKGFTIRDSQFGKQISIAVVTQDGTMNYLQLPIFNEKNQLTPFTEGFTTYLPYLKADYIYRFFPYNIKDKAENGKEYTKMGMSVKYVMNDYATINGAHSVERMTQTYTTKTGEHVVGMIPEAFWVQGVNGNEQDRRNKDMFLWTTLNNFKADSISNGNKMQIDENAGVPQPVTAGGTPVAAQPVTPVQAQPVAAPTQTPVPVAPQAAPVPTPTPAAPVAPMPPAPAAAPMPPAPAPAPVAAPVAAPAPAPVPAPVAAPAPAPVAAPVPAAPAPMPPAPAPAQAVASTPGVQIHTEAAPMIGDNIDKDDLPF